LNIVISLDYEIFFGRNGSGVQRTLVDPSTALSHIARRHGVPLVFFVDAAWLLRLREEAVRHPAVMAEHYRVMRQLESFVAAGHELQLHVHPHWVDSHWDGQGWVLDLRRYRLHDFSDREIAEIVMSCRNSLQAVAGAQAITAFRAGGWCLQPWSRLREPLRAAGICIDSTVYAGGLQQGTTQDHDFRDSPAHSRWFFEDDPLQPDAEGSFLELPIASHAVSPLFFWRLALTRQLRLPGHRPWSDGAAIPLAADDLKRKLTRRTTSVVSIDGLKSQFLEAAFQAHRRRGQQDFVIIGHPKAFTPYSLRRLEHFLQAHPHEDYIGLNDYLHEFRLCPARSSRPHHPLRLAS